MPPAVAIAIAILLSVTVSIADESNGIFNLRFSVNLILVSTSEGRISEYLGANVTSSKVSASLIGSITIYIRFLFFLKSLSEIFTNYEAFFGVFSAGFWFKHFDFFKNLFSKLNDFIK